MEVHLRVVRSSKCFRSGLNGDSVVTRQASTSRDELTENNVLLKANERIGLAVHRCLGENLRRLLEGCRRQPRVGCQRRLRDTHKHLTTGSRLPALGSDLAVLRQVSHTVNKLAGHESRITGLKDGNSTQHLANDDLNVLRVDTDALIAVDLLDLVNKLLLRDGATHDANDFLRIKLTLSQRLACLDMLAFSDKKLLTTRDLNNVIFLRIITSNDDATNRRILVINVNATSGLAHLCFHLRTTSLKEFLNSWQTLGNISCRCGATGVERTHRELSTGLTNRLRGDNANCFTNIDLLAGGQRATIAGSTGADL